MPSRLVCSNEVRITTLVQPLHDIDSIRWGTLGKFFPVSDLTPVESARLAVLFTCASKDISFDLEGYARKHNLTRHFDGQ